MHTILILGGYGFFGARIAASLVRNPAIRLLIGGRNRARAVQAAGALGLTEGNAVQIDASAADLAERLAQLKICTLIHVAGPFQAQDYRVATAAIGAGCHYIDLADGRDFVAGIRVLDARAKARSVSIISGASSVPALSSAVVDRYRPGFARLDRIRTGIGSGAKAPGLATMQGVFGYCGKPVRRWEDGAWVQTFGWLDTIRYRFPPPVGVRWLGSCDVPDLELFPARYGARTVTFHAGFAGRLGHFAVWLGATLVRAGVLRSLAPLARPLHGLCGWLEPLVSDKGGMFVELHGVDLEGRPLTRRWCLLAAKNHGPYIPCGASIALAEKLAAGSALPAGAYPCVGLLTVAAYLAPLHGLAIREIPPSDPR